MSDGLLLGLFLVGVGLIVSSQITGRLYSIPPMHFAVVKIFGNPWRVATEGLAFLASPLETWEIFTTELQAFDVSIPLKSKGGLPIIMNGRVEFSMDPALFKSDQSTVGERVEGVVTEAIKKGFGMIAGALSAEDEYDLPKKSKNKGKVGKWVDDLAEDASFNFGSYAECFVSENLIRVDTPQT